LLRVPTEITEPRIFLAESDYAANLKRNWFYISAVDRVLRPEFYTIPDQKYIYIFCDSELVVQRLLAITEVLSTTNDLGIRPGAVLSEESFGTNALALSKEYRRLLAVQGKHHYCRVLKRWSSVASPIKDPQGNIRGYLNIFMHQDNVPLFTAMFLKLLVYSTERELLLLFHHQQLSSVSPDPSPVLSNEVNQKLTKREKEILGLKLRGLNNKEIAYELSLSYYTVATHCRNIYSKLGNKNILKCMCNDLESRWNTSNLY